MKLTSKQIEYVYRVVGLKATEAEIIADSHHLYFTVHIIENDSRYTVKIPRHPNNLDKMKRNS